MNRYTGAEVDKPGNNKSSNDSHGCVMSSDLKYQLLDLLMNKRQIDRIKYFTPDMNDMHTMNKHCMFEN